MGISMAEDVAQAPEGEAPAQGEGGIVEFLTKLDQALLQVNQALASNDGAPAEAKEAFGAAHEAFRAGLAILTGEGGEAPQQSGAVSMEAGASGARPVSMGRPA